MDNPLQKSSSI